MWSLAVQKTMAVIHQAPTRSKEPHAYYVFDGATRYQHVLTAGIKEQGSNGSNGGKTD